MKLKSLFFAILMASISLECFSQKNVRDSLKEFTIEVVRKAMEKGKVKKLAVWDFTNMNKEVFNFGSYIAEQFSVYADQVDSVELMDRQNLKSVLNEHKLKSEGFIDKSTIMELGKFKDVDAVVVGSVIMAGKDFQIIVKIIETSLGRTVAADEQYFEIDSRLAATLGVEFGGNTDSNSPNLGYNRPLNSNEQYNNSSTVNKECEKLNTGDYCFYNASDEKIIVKISTSDNLAKYYETQMTLNPKESKCIYSQIATTYKFNAYFFDNITKGSDYGVFLIEKCKSKTFSIKIKEKVEKPGTRTY